MTTIKNWKLLSLFGLMCMFSVSLWAQPGPGGPEGQRATPEEMAQRQTARLTQALNLSEDQQSQVHAIHLKHIEAFRAFRMENWGDREAIMQKRQEMMLAQGKEIEALLDETQQAEFEKLRKKREQNRSQKGGKKKQKNP